MRSSVYVPRVPLGMKYAWRWAVYLILIVKYRDATVIPTELWVAGSLLLITHCRIIARDTKEMK